MARNWTAINEEKGNRRETAAEEVPPTVDPAVELLEVDSADRSLEVDPAAESGAVVGMVLAEVCVAEAAAEATWEIESAVASAAVVEMVLAEVSAADATAELPCESDSVVAFASEVVLGSEEAGVSVVCAAGKLVEAIYPVEEARPMFVSKVCVAYLLYTSGPTSHW